MTLEAEVMARYSQGAQAKQADLCCPVDYDRSLLALLPQEIIEKDYGCGDPSRYVNPGDVVLDLGSGSGKICYMAAQLVGDRGGVIGVDINDDMLTLARKYQAEMARKLGADRVQFVKGHIQDLALDVAAMDAYLLQNPVNSAQDLIRLQNWQARQRIEAPLIKDNSVDLVVSNCVLNLVKDEDKAKLIREIFRVVKPGGRVAISDIVSDERVPARLKGDHHLWSGCISGALQENEFLEAFVNVGFVAVAFDKWESQPWRVVDGIEFRSVTITAVKPETQPCLDKGHAVIYRGPFAEVYDEDGHVYYRGQRMAVCERTFRLLTDAAYGGQFIGIAPCQELAGKLWDCATGTIRPASETKSGEYVNECSTSAGCC